jgi:hypothetical protein
MAAVLSLLRATCGCCLRSPKQTRVSVKERPSTEEKNLLQFCQVRGRTPELVFVGTIGRALAIAALQSGAT